MTIDINCDLGESFGRYSVGNDLEIMPYISSCNIACGFHGGDPRVIIETIKNAYHHKLKIEIKIYLECQDSNRVNN